MDKQRLTQVGRAMKELRVQMIAAYSPQARAGRSAVLEPSRGPCRRNFSGGHHHEAPTLFCGDSTSESSTLSSECHLKKRGQLSGAPAGRI